MEKLYLIQNNKIQKSLNLTMNPNVRKARALDILKIKYIFNLEISGKQLTQLYINGILQISDITLQFGKHEHG